MTIREGAGQPVRVHREVCGSPDGPALVLSNSLGTSLEMWDTQLARLSAHVRLIRYDTRGHGRSPVPPGPYEIEDLAADLLALLDDLGIGRAHLCGLSLGGLTALQVATTAPERVASVTVLSAPARFGKPELYRERAQLVRAKGTAEVADGVVGRWLTPEFATRHPEIVARLRSMIATTPPEGYAACCDAVAAADLRPSLAGISAPVLCVVAENDPALSVPEVEALAQGIRHSRFVAVADAAHLVNVEKPDQVSELILSHLTSTTGGGAG